MRYDSGMSRIALAIVFMTSVTCANLETVSATQQFSALLFAADAASDASDAASDASNAAREAASQTGGRVLNVKKYLRGDTPVYDVKVLLDDGRVKIIQLEGKGAPEQGPNGE